MTWRPSLHTTPLDEVRSEALAGPSARIEQSLDARRALERCGAQMAREMSAGQRRILRLRYFENQPIRAIARRCGKTTDAVRVALCRGRRKPRAGRPELGELLSG